MARYLWIGILSLLSATNGLAQSCTTSNARPIDADVAFLAYWEIIVVSWAAIAAIGKRDLPHPSLSKRDLVCTSAEQCLSFKGYPFCDNPSTHTFHAADGTTGNFVTGAYTLADGRQGNMYHGPYPTNTIVAAATQTESMSAASLSVVTVTAASSIGTPVISSAGASTAASLQVVGSSQVVAGASTATKTPIPTPNSSTVLRSDGSHAKFNYSSAGRIFLVVLSVFFCFLHL